MKLGAKLAALAGIGVALCALVAGPMSPEPAQAYGTPRIIVDVAGPGAGTVEFENLGPNFFPDLLVNNDTGELVMPTNYCGLRVEHVGGVWWFDNSGDVIEGDSGEVTSDLHLNGDDIEYYYLSGMKFTGALTTCDTNEPWSFQYPLTYGGNGPHPDAAYLVLDLDPPQNYYPTIEFLDDAVQPMALPDLYKGWNPPGGLEEYCEQIPEFCEPEPDPWDPKPVKPWIYTEMIYGCVVKDLSTGLCPSEPDPKEYPDFTLGCMAYATGCDPDPQTPPLETYAAPSTDPVQVGESVQVGSPAKSLQGTR